MKIFQFIVANLSLASKRMNLQKKYIYLSITPYFDFSV